MKNYKIDLGLEKLEKVLVPLEIIAVKPHHPDRSNIDATIQRFEFTIELFWKVLKAILESKGVAVQYPKDILREAFKGRLIDQEQEWLKMMNDRNLTSHTYNERLADEVFIRIQHYVPTFRKTLDRLAAQIKEETL